MTEHDAKSALRATWEAAAPGWAKWEDKISLGLAEATEALLEEAGIREGHRVLDLACGAGSQTLLAAARVGSSGRVVAADISETMLDHLRRSAEARGLENIETHASPAEELDASLAPFDAGLCRLGLMLFPSPDSAVSGVRGLLKPGARFAAMVFTTPQQNPFMAQPMQILLRHAGKQPPAPGQPGIFSLGAEGALASLLARNGLTDVRTRTARASLVAPGVADALVMMQEAFGAYRAVVAGLDEAARAKAWLEVRECLGQFEAGGRFEARLEFVIGSGARD